MSVRVGRSLRDEHSIEDGERGEAKQKDPQADKEHDHELPLALHRNVLLRSRFTGFGKPEVNRGEPQFRNREAPLNRHPFTDRMPWGNREILGGYVILSLP